MTLKVKARSLGVSPSTLQHIIKTRGRHYKSAPPEDRAATLKAHREYRRALLDANVI
jgi:hypothetical protein